MAARTDEELALALQEGNARAFEELVRRHQGRVYAVAYRITLNREDALDAAQESLVKAFQKIHAWQPTSGFVPWLMRLTTNHAIDLVRKRNRRRHESLDDEAQTSGRTAHDTHASRDTEQQVRAEEIDQRVNRALSVLSVTQRAVFAMRHYEGLQLNEIAEVIGCTVGSVKVHLFRALKKMQVELRDLYED